MRSRFIQATNRALSRLAFREYSASSEGLAVYRILYATVILLMGLPRALWIPHYGSAFFRPPFGFTWFLEQGVPPEWFFLLLNGAATLSVIMLLAGYRTRVASLVVFVSLLSLNAWRYSFGKIDHDLMIIVVPLILAFSGWGDRLSVDSLGGRRARFYTNSPWLLLLAAVTSVMMFTAAIQKVHTGWLEPHTLASWEHFVRSYFVLGSKNPVSTIALGSPIPWLWKCTDLAVVALETAFLFVFPSRRWFRITCALACIFHFLAAVLMHIVFWSNVLAYAAFCNWDGWLKRAAVRNAANQTQLVMQRLRLPHIALASLLVTVIHLSMGIPASGFFLGKFARLFFAR
jgi:hypothetical protein